MKQGRGAVAVLGGRGLGDNLIEMVLVENARRAGFRATMYSDVLGSLTTWFPFHRIFPSLPLERMEEELRDYGCILEPKPPRMPLCPAICSRWIDYGRMYRDDRSQVRNMMAISRQVFNIGTATATIGIVPPEHLTYRRHADRVCIHPTSAETSKNWLPQRFLHLGRRLAASGFRVAFIMSRGECAQWRPVIGEAFPLHGFADVAECAAFLYESGYFIGNDSGGGHLASCLGIPTLSIHGRKGKAVRWRPDWGAVEVVTPRINLIGSFLRQHYWKYMLPVGSVERGFFRLVRKAT
jgi:hypothetical protein